MPKLNFIEPELVNPEILDGPASHVLRLAAADMKRVSRRKGYIINMSNYHKLKDYEKFNNKSKFENITIYTKSKNIIELCSVCLGGSIMAGTLEQNRNKSISIGKLPRKITQILIAVDGVRVGHFRDLLKICRPNSLPLKNKDMMKKLWAIKISYHGILTKKQIAELIAKLHRAASILESYGY